MRRIAILEGHPIAAVGLKELIDSAPGLELSGMHTDGRLLVSSMREHPVEAVAIDLDVEPNQLRGPQLIELLRAASPSLDIIIIVSVVDATTRREYFKGGATAVLDKANDCSVLLAPLSGSTRS